MNGHPLVYLDSAATSQKPRAVLDALVRFYEESNANVHRGVYRLAEDATRLYEGARSRISAFVGASSERQILFVRNATEGVNLVAHAWGDSHVREGDEILVTRMEHHSNLVPWQMLARRNGARIREIPVTQEGLLDMEALENALTDRVRLLAVTHVSNVLATVNPVAEIVRAARERGIAVLVDAAQSVPHMPVDLAAMDPDFLVFSGHKMLGPTGVGVLCVRESVLDDLPPFLGGGEMIREVDIQESTYADAPWRFEAGTPNAAGVVALGAAVDYLSAIGMDNVAAHSRALGSHARARLGKIPGLSLLGPPPGPDSSGSLVSFTLDGFHPHDLAQVLDSRGIAIRAGHMCCQPLMKRYGLPAVNRASFHVYTSMTEVDQFADEVARIVAESHRALFPVVAGEGVAVDRDKMPDDELFREVILDHYLIPEGREPIGEPSIEESGVNPLCGDEVTLRVRVLNDHIDAIQVDGHGCSISVASGSMLAGRLKGRTLAEARLVLSAFKGLLTDRPMVHAPDLGDLEVLGGLREMPVRIKCALLPWTTLEHAIGRLPRGPARERPGQQKENHDHASKS
jgi:cysteine desulfurase/selenocysteine lyase